MSSHDDRADAAGTADVVREVTCVGEDGRRMAVRVLPYRSRTHLVILDIDNHPWFFGRANLPPTTNEWIRAVADFTADEQDYGWDTPRYRELCIAGGLDPDHHRPTFADTDAAMGDALVAVVDRTRGGPSPGAANVMLDLIDVMRVDPWRTHVDPEALAQRFAETMRSDPKTGAEVIAIIRKVTNGAGDAQIEVLNGKAGGMR